MATLKEFEEALRSYNMVSALAVLEELRKRDRAKRTIAPARRVVGKKMTPELAATILEMHKTTTMTQQEIAFKLGVNQGRVNEVIKRGKWLTDDPKAPEQVARDKALKRFDEGPKKPRERKPAGERKAKEGAAKRKPAPQAQLALGDF
jgi:hypothetical protein